MTDTCGRPAPRPSEEGASHTAHCHSPEVGAAVTVSPWPTLWAPCRRRPVTLGECWSEVGPAVTVSPSSWPTLCAPGLAARRRGSEPRTGAGHRLTVGLSRHCFSRPRGQGRGGWAPGHRVHPNKGRGGVGGGGGVRFAREQLHPRRHQVDTTQLVDFPNPKCYQGIEWSTWQMRRGTLEVQIQNVKLRVTRKAAH